jgi:hypothetical protein
LLTSLTQTSVAKTFPRERMTNSPTIVWLANLTRLSSIFGVNQNEEQIRARLRQYKKQLDRLVEGGNSNPEFKALAVDITKTLEGSITTDLQKLNALLISAAGDGNFKWLKECLSKGADINARDAYS